MKQSPDTSNFPKQYIHIHNNRRYASTSTRCAESTHISGTEYTVSTREYGQLRPHSGHQQQTSSNAGVHRDGNRTAHKQGGARGDYNNKEDCSESGGVDKGRRRQDRREGYVLQQLFSGVP
jgi:hypothetical protein